MNVRMVLDKLLELDILLSPHDEMVMESLLSKPGTDEQRHKLVSDICAQLIKLEGLEERREELSKKSRYIKSRIASIMEPPQREVPSLQSLGEKYENLLQLVQRPNRQHERLNSRTSLLSKTRLSKSESDKHGRKKQLRFADDIFTPSMPTDYLYVQTFPSNCGH